MKKVLLTLLLVLVAVPAMSQSNAYMDAPQGDYTPREIRAIFSNAEMDFVDPMDDRIGRMGKWLADDMPNQQTYAPPCGTAMGWRFDVCITAPGDSYCTVYYRLNKVVFDQGGVWIVEHTEPGKPHIRVIPKCSAGY